MAYVTSWERMARKEIEEARKGVEEARKEARKEADERVKKEREKAKLETAKRMLMGGLSIEQVIEFTGLPEKKIRTLIN